MYSTQLNICTKNSKNSIGAICRKYLKFPDQTSSRRQKVAYVAKVSASNHYRKNPLFLLLRLFTMMIRP